MFFFEWNFRLRYELNSAWKSIKLFFARWALSDGLVKAARTSHKRLFTFSSGQWSLYWMFGYSFFGKPSRSGGIPWSYHIVSSAVCVANQSALYGISRICVGEMYKQDRFHQIY